jgi:hypothetical protein
VTIRSIIISVLFVIPIGVGIADDSLTNNDDSRKQSIRDWDAISGRNLLMIERALPELSKRGLYVSNYNIKVIKKISSFLIEFINPSNQPALQVISDGKSKKIIMHFGSSDAAPDIYVEVDSTGRNILSAIIQR